MSDEIQRFCHNEFGELEVLRIGEKFYFPATECARILGYTNPKAAVLRHCKGDGVTKRDRVSFTTNQYGTTTAQNVNSKYISEGNLYRLIILSKLESAQRFEAWVFDTVLPTIRKHGAYILPELLEWLQQNAEESSRLYQELAEARRKRSELLEQNKELESRSFRLLDEMEALKPKVGYYDLILKNPDAVPVTLIAKDYGMSAVRFNAMLHNYGIQFCVGGTWSLYQEYANNGYTHYNMMVTKNGNEKMHMCWTQRGRLFLYDFLKAYGIVPKIEQEEPEYAD